MALADVNKEKGRLLDQAARKNSQATPDEKGPEVVEKISVIFQNEEYILRTDGGDLDARNKLTGHGFTITQKGDFIFVSGPGGKGNPCGGRFMINTTGGKLEKHDGPAIAEYNANSTNATATEEGEGDGSTSGLAKSEICHGDSREEVHGEKRISGTHVVIEATGLLNLVGLGGLNLQAGVGGGGTITMNAGVLKMITRNKEEIVFGQSTSLTSEKSDVQLDPRGTTAIVSAGNKSEKFLGDMKKQVVGKYELGVVGSKGGLVYDPKSAFNLYSLNGDIKLSTKVGSILGSAGVEKPDFSGATPGSMIFTAAKDFKTTSTLATELTAVTSVKLNATTDVSVDAKGLVNITATGNVNITGALIYLN